MTPINVNYCILTPTRDEEKFLAATIECVVAQSIQPAEWIIINDGSKDRTGEIIDKYAANYSWIRALHRPDRGFRTTGGGVEAFLDGLQLLYCKDWDFLVNLDGDVTFGADYFETCFLAFGKTRYSALPVEPSTTKSVTNSNLKSARPFMCAAQPRFTAVNVGNNLADWSVGLAGTRSMKLPQT